MQTDLPKSVRILRLKSRVTRWGQRTAYGRAQRVRDADLLFDPARLVFIGETCTNTAMVWLRGRVPRGERLFDYAPHGAWTTVTFVGGLRQRGMTTREP
jgi:hypothetical protein